jgi:hypothetical protein
MRARGAWLAGLGIMAAIAAAGLARPRATLHAQSPASLSDEAALSLVLPPLADGSRPGVHLWARADQAVGPGGLPTVFIVTLYTKQTPNGPEEHEVVNYVQYSNGGWAPARPRDDGTLLIDDWAWISSNLKNLTATVSGQGNNSQYTVDYLSSGTYAGAPRQIAIEEVYGPDLSLLSSVVLQDTSPPPSAASATAISAPASTAATPVSTPRTAPTTSASPATTAVPATPAVTGPVTTLPAFPTGTPAGVLTPPPSQIPGAPVR